MLFKEIKEGIVIGKIFQGNKSDQKARLKIFPITVHYIYLLEALVLQSLWLYFEISEYLSYLGCVNLIAIGINKFFIFELSRETTYPISS